MKFLVNTTTVILDLEKKQKQKRQLIKPVNEFSVYEKCTLVRWAVKPNYPTFKHPSN